MLAIQLPLTLLSLLMIFMLLYSTNSETSQLLKRHKRFLWMSKDRKLIFPPGSSLIVTPKLQIPFIRQPPEGINSDIQISWPFYLFFDGLGMTNTDHPWPPFFPFSDMFYNASSVSPSPAKKEKKTPSKGDDKDKDASIKSKANGGSRNRIRRNSFGSVLSLPPPEKLAGGERAILLPKLEMILNSFGMNGRACLLRTICEIHEFPLDEGYGLFGEFVTLFFSISSSSYAETHLPEYLKAELIGRETEDGCLKYHKDCSKSIFTWEDKVKNRPKG